jgi:succinyl-CoA synthetase beta subunit
MIFHAFELLDDEVYAICVDSNEDRMMAVLSTYSDMDIEVLAIGTVTAIDTQEASEKIKRGDWEYSMKV